MDDLAKSKSDIRSIAFPDIPTPDEHSREARKIFVACGAFAAILFALAVAVVLLSLHYGVPLQTIAFVVPIVMGIGIATFFVAYAMPIGLVSLKRLELTLRMGYKGLLMNQEVTSSIKGMVKKVEPTVKKIEDNLESIASKIRRDTTPLPIRERVTTGD